MNNPKQIKVSDLISTCPHLTKAINTLRSAHGLKPDTVDSLPSEAQLTSDQFHNIGIANEFLKDLETGKIKLPEEYAEIQDPLTEFCTGKTDFLTYCEESFIGAVTASNILDSVYQGNLAEQFIKVLNTPIVTYTSVKPMKLSKPGASSKLKKSSFIYCIITKHNDLYEADCILSGTAYTNEMDQLKLKYAFSKGSYVRALKDKIATERIWRVVPSKSVPKKYKPTLEELEEKTTRESNVITPQG